MLSTIAPIDTALLALVQLIQPASTESIIQETTGTIVAKLLSEHEVASHLQHLEDERFILRTASGAFVVAPKSYAFIHSSMDSSERDKARLLTLNREWYQ